MASELAVLDEGKHHVVVDKPADMLVVRGRGVPGPTLLDLVQERFGKGCRPVHRLDRPTTGCCVFAKTEFGQQALSDAFRRRLVDKRYLALVVGVPEWTKLAIDARLKRVDDPNAKKGPLAWQTVADDGQRALTRARVLARGDGVALVEARLETGRMHQIRAHLAHTGFPLVGDELYGDAARKDALRLHAWLLSFPAPHGGRRFVAAPLPGDFTRALRDAAVDARERLADEEKKFTVRGDKPKAPAKKKAGEPRGSAKAKARSKAGRAGGGRRKGRSHKKRTRR